MPFGLSIAGAFYYESFVGRRGELDMRRGKKRPVAERARDCVMEHHSLTSYSHVRRLLSTRVLLMAALTTALLLKANLEDRGQKAYTTFHPMTRPLLVPSYVVYGWPMPFLVGDLHIFRATVEHFEWRPLAMCLDLGTLALLTSFAAMWGFYGRPVRQFTLLTLLLLPVLVGLLITLVRLLHAEVHLPNTSEAVSIGLVAGLLFVAVAIK